MARELALRLVELARNDGGGTIDPRTGEVVEAESGYIVGGVVPTFTIEDDDPALVDAVEGFIRENSEGLVGIWLHEGVAYLDAVELVDDLFDAVILAHAREELAIWDCAAQQEIDTRRGA